VTVFIDPTTSKGYNDLSKVRDHATRELEKHNAVIDALTDRRGNIKASQLQTYFDHYARAMECKGMINTVSMILDGQVRVGLRGEDSVSRAVFRAAGYVFESDKGKG
jgi:coenzyme F420-reducing hydrogenase alpha subunit